MRSFALLARRGLAGCTGTVHGATAGLLVCPYPRQFQHLWKGYSLPSSHCLHSPAFLDGAGFMVEVE